MRFWTKDGGQSWSCRTVLAEGHSEGLFELFPGPLCGKYIAPASFDGTMLSGTARLELRVQYYSEGHENEVKCAVFSRSRATSLATCSRDKSVWLWMLTMTMMSTCVQVSFNSTGC